MWMATLGISSRSLSKATSREVTAWPSWTSTRPATLRGRSSQVEQIMPP